MKRIRIDPMKTYTDTQIQLFSAQTIQQEVYFTLFNSIRIDYKLLFMVS